MCFFGTSAFFSLLAAGIFSLSAPWHAGSPAGYHGASLALAEVRGTCSGGSKWQVPTGSDSEHVEPSRPPTYRLKECPTANVQVKRRAITKNGYTRSVWSQKRVQPGIKSKIPSTSHAIGQKQIVPVFQRLLPGYTCKWLLCSAFNRF